MNRSELSKALDNIEDRYVEEAMLPVYQNIQNKKGEDEMNITFNFRRTRRKVITLAVAACLLMALGVGAYAAGSYINSPEAAEKVVRREVEVWKDLGLLSRDFALGETADRIIEREEETGDSYWFGRIFPHNYMVFINSEKYLSNFSVDTATGKLVSVCIQAMPDENEEPAFTEEVEVEIYDTDEKELKKEMQTWEFYENFDDIFPANLTVDRYCSLLAEYWGFTGYTISDTSDEFYHETWEAVSGDMLLTELPHSNRDNYYLTVFFDGDQRGAPMYIQLTQYPDSVNMLIGTGHAVG